MITSFDFEKLQKKYFHCIKQVLGQHQANLVNQRQVDVRAQIGRRSNKQENRAI